jgi:DNA modification methylase
VTARLLIGDVFARLAEIPDASVDLVVTSPPFLALRSYLPADHPDKALEIGSEATPADFLDTLLALSAEWGRVLAPHGSICVELGDTYSGGTAEGSDTRNPDSQRFRGAADGVLKPKQGDGWPLAKSLCGIPHLYHLSLAYGRNLLTGEESPAGQWRVRNVLCWARPNPPVGALGDKFRPATSYVTVACRAKDRWFDLDAVRVAEGIDQREPTGKSAERGGNWSTLPVRDNNGAGAPPLDWIDERDIDWQPLIRLPTQPYKGAHYATFPSALPARLIQAMCPREVCTGCGEPRRRITEKTPEYAAKGRNWADAGAEGRGKADTRGRNNHSGQPPGDYIVSAEYETLGWSVCDCTDPAYRPGLVLDPFAGSGTTLAAAIGAGRDAIGIELDGRNADLARERCGIFLEVAS